MSLLMRRKIFKPNENCSEIPFNKEITNTLNELAIVQCSIKKLNQQAKNEINQTKTKFENHRKHLCEKRSKQIEKIPNFWLTAFKNNQEIHGLFEDSFMSDDEEDDDDDFPAPFQHFKRFEVVEFEKSPSLSNKRGFKLNFYFNPRTNPFFKNRVIFKEFCLDKYDCYTCKSSDIDWDPHYKNILDDCSHKESCFFAWLSDDRDDSYGEEFKEEIWLNPVKYYLTTRIKKTYDSDDDSNLNDSDHIDGVSKYELGFGRYGTTWSECMDQSELLGQYDQSQILKKDSDETTSFASIHSSSFKDFLLKPELIRALMDCGFEHPSQVQHECIPQAILNMDVICQAKSGMGKTAVFALASLQQLEPIENRLSVLVLCHTRELAFQISKEFERFGKYISGVKVGVFFGGLSIKRDEEKLKKQCPNIVIGTPGRILALVRSQTLDLRNLKHFVLDECDDMLNQLDMRSDVQEIFQNTPHDKQVMMFSATLSKEMRSLCKKFMQNPFEVYVDNETNLTLHGLQQHYVKVKDNEKNRMLLNIIDAFDFNQVIIFVKSIQRCESLAQLLVEQNVPAFSIHSGMSQEERLEKYQQFKNFDKRILVSTNLFGRGIDIERVNVVLNYDMPDNTDVYLHRVARAGRFGTKGFAITFVSEPAEVEVLNEIQKRFCLNITELTSNTCISTNAF